jgi:uncharacterized protein YdeI (YjbR/CyaY-like superfamily)
MNPKVDFYFTKENRWQAEISGLRSILLACGLTEELKWGVPCYSFQKNNIVLIHIFKEYCAVLFFKGALLTDTAGILIRQTENVQAARQIRFTSLSEIHARESILKAYVFEAIEVEKAGLQVAFKQTKEFDVPDEFQLELDQNPALWTAFRALTPGRQRAYLLYFSQAKQSKTRRARIARFGPQILNGKGLDD